MSTKTSNYQLHQWEPSDQFLREDFNTDFAKIDAGIKHAYDHAGQVESNLTAQLTSTRNTLNTAIGKKADQTALTALQSTVNKKADKTTVTALQNQMPVKLEIGAWGSYTGAGNNQREINVGFRPKVVFMETNEGRCFDNAGTWGGWFTDEHPLQTSGTTNIITAITDTGFILSSRSFDYKNSVYYYLCLK